MDEPPGALWPTLETANFFCRVGKGAVNKREPGHTQQRAPCPRD
jgi:hypothetical protein